MTFTVGALVRVRGREWVILPDSTDGVLMVRPLGGTDDEVTGIFTELEPIESATFCAKSTLDRISSSVVIIDVPRSSAKILFSLLPAGPLDLVSEMI